FENFINWSQFKPVKILIKNLPALIGIYFNECLALRKLLPIKKSLALLSSNIFKANCVLDTLKSKSDIKNFDLKEAIFYSFWFYDCIFLAWMKKNNLIHKAYSRAHGGDLYEERNSLGKILFRNFQLKNI
ncbi:MAG: hypothetical protein ACKPKO_02725, partial [Candidatus Fonsibacter sp.]